MSAQGLPIVLTETKNGAQFDLNSKQFVYALTQGINGPNPIVGPAANTTTGIVAHAGGSQGSATLLAAIYNIVTTVATAGDSVKLPVAVVGTWYVITNSGAASLNIFPATSGTINAGSTNAAIALLPGAQIILVGTSTTNWNTTYPSIVYYLDNAATLRKRVVNEDIVAISVASQFLVQVTNAAGQNLYLNVDRIETYGAFFSPLTGPAAVSYNNVTAKAGGGQTTATDPTLLTANENFVTVTTVATTGDSITLPVGTFGSRFVIYNTTGTSLNVFPFTSGTINGGSANAAIAVAAGIQTIFTADSTGINWVSSSPVVTRIIYNSEQAADKIFDVTQSVSSLSTAIDLIISPELATTPQLASANTFTAANTFSAASGVTTATITPATAGNGTAIQVPVIPGTAFASPTALTAAQSGSICLLNAATGNVFTLPAATAANTGVRYRFIQTATVTSNSASINAATSSDLFVAGGNIFQTKAATDGVLYSPNGSSNYQYTANGSTTGGIIGDIIEVVCLGLNKWLVNGTQSASGTVATPFAG